MIKLTKENIDKAIISKGNNIVRKNQTGYILTDETICTFNSLMIFKELFDNKCKMLSTALENLYYIADRLINCGGGDGPTPQDVYYTVKVTSNKTNARYYINGVERSSATFAEGTRNIQIRVTCSGYNDKTYTISKLTRDYNVYLEFTQDDIIPSTQYTVTVNCNVSNPLVTMNGISGFVQTFPAGTNVHIVVSKEGYETFETVITNLSRNETVDAILEPEASDVTLKVITTPSSASVTIYDKTRNRTYPNIKEKSFPVGTVVKIVASLEGFDDFERDNIVLLEDTTLNVTLEAIQPELYSVVVTPTPIDSNVTITNLDNNTAHSSGDEFEEGTHLSILVTKEGYFNKTVDYTVDSADAVGGVITRAITLDQKQTVIVDVWKDALGTEALDNATISLVDTVTNNNVTPAAHPDGNTWRFEGLVLGRTYNLTVTKSGYTQQTNTSFVVATNNQTVNVYMQANSYNLKVIAVDADNNNTPIQVATVTVNGNPVTYANGESENVSIPGGTEVEIAVSSGGYQNVNPVRITMPFGDYTYLFYLSASTATLHVYVFNGVTDAEITSNCTIKINGVTGNDQTISPGTVNIEVTHPYVDGHPAYTSYVGTKNIVAGANNVTIELDPYVGVLFQGVGENISGQGWVELIGRMSFESLEQDDGILFTKQTVDDSIQIWVPYENTIGGIFHCEHYNDQTVELHDITASYQIQYVYFTRRDVKVTINRPEGSVVYMDEVSNVITGNEVWVRKGTYHRFVCTKQGYNQSSRSATYLTDTTIRFDLTTPIYIHITDSHNNNITGLTYNEIEVIDALQPQDNLYDDNSGEEIYSGTYHVDGWDGNYTLNINVPGYNAYTQHFLVRGEKHLSVKLTESTVNLNILVRDTSNSSYINDATIYVDNEIVNNLPVSVDKGIHTIKVQKSGYGTITQTVNLTQDETVTIDIKPTVTAHIHAHKSDVPGPTGYNAVHVVYLVGSSNVPVVVNNTNNNITYELPYNTVIRVNASATNYNTKEQTYTFTEESLEVFIDLEITPKDNTLTLYVIDAQTDMEITDAEVTFNIE